MKCKETLEEKCKETLEEKCKEGIYKFIKLLNCCERVKKAPLDHKKFNELGESCMDMLSRIELGEKLNEEEVSGLMAFGKSCEKDMLRYLDMNKGDIFELLVPKDSPLNWYGGKYNMRKALNRILPPHKNYIEVFGGAMHLGLYKDIAPGINCYNDLNFGLYTFFSVVSDKKKYKRLREKLAFTLYHQKIWEKCKDWILEKDDVERAWQFYVRTMQSRSSNGKSWSYSKTESRRNMSGCVSKWLSNVEDNLPNARKKISHFTIENSDFEELIEKYDSEDSLFYVDPPYVTGTRTYKKGYDHEMTDEDHERLVDVLIKTKGYVILSGYDNDIYKRLEEHGFIKILLKEVTKSSINVNRMDKKGKEYVWINYDLPSEIIYTHIIEEFFEPLSKYRDESLNGRRLTKLTKKRAEDFFRDLGIECVPSDYFEFMLKYNGAIRKDIVNDKGELFDIKTIFAIDIDGDLDPNKSLAHYIRKYRGAIKDGYLPVALTENDDVIFIGMNYNDIVLYSTEHKMSIGNLDGFSFVMLIDMLFEKYKGYIPEMEELNL